VVPNRKLEAVRQHSPPLSPLGPLCGPIPSTVGSLPFPFGRCCGESTHTHSCGTRHRRRSGSHRYFFRSASVPSLRSESIGPSLPAWSAQQHLQQRPHSAERHCRRRRCRSRALPSRAPFLSFPFFSLLRRRVTSWRLVSPLPALGVRRVPLPAAAARAPDSLRNRPPFCITIPHRFEESQTAVDNGAEAPERLHDRPAVEWPESHSVESKQLTNQVSAKINQKAGPQTIDLRPCGQCIGRLDCLTCWCCWKSLRKRSAAAFSCLAVLSTTSPMAFSSASR